MTSPILVVGSVALDTVETPFGRGDDLVGGSATYFSAAASHFTPVRIVGVVGDDFPLADLDFLKKRGVDLDGVQVVNGGRTFRWSGRYHYDLNHRDTLDTQLNVFADFDPVLPDGWRDSRYVFLANIDPELQLKVLDQVHDPAMVLCDTMNFWIEGKRDALEKVLARVDGVILNDEEARELSGEPNLVKAAQSIQDLGPDTVIVKKGEHGALLFDREGVFSAPAYPLEDVYDPTGAGDTFAGGYFGFLTRVSDGNGGKPPNGTRRKAVVYGSALASFCVQEFGVARLRELDPDEVELRFDAFRRLSSF